MAALRPGALLVLVLAGGCPAPGSALGSDDAVFLPPLVPGDMELRRAV